MATMPSASATPTSTSCATADFSTFLQQTKDVACAVGSTAGLPSNYKDILKGCCKSAPVQSLSNDCALYCLSVEQSVADLQKCFQDGGVNPAWIFCSANNTATATSKPSASSHSGSGTSSDTPSVTQSGAAASSSHNAANVMGAPAQGVSKAGLGVVAMIGLSAVFGAFL